MVFASRKASVGGTLGFKITADASGATALMKTISLTAANPVTPSTEVCSTFFFKQKYWQWILFYFDNHFTLSDFKADTDCVL